MNKQPILIFSIKLIVINGTGVPLHKHIIIWIQETTVYCSYDNFINIFIKILQLYAESWAVWCQYENKIYKKIILPYWTFIMINIFPDDDFTSNSINIYCRKQYLSCRARLCLYYTSIYFATWVTVLQFGDFKTLYSSLSLCVSKIVNYRSICHEICCILNVNNYNKWV